MPISWPRSAIWQALLVLAVFFVGFITLSKTASGCFIPRDGRMDPNNPYCWTPTPAPTPTPIPLRYEVQPGDTLSAIATRYDVTVDDLVRVNRLVNPDVIQVGQYLIIPTQPPSPASNDPWGTAIPIIIGTLVWLLCFAGLIVFARRR